METRFKKVAIVHDWLYGGGAEKVVLELHQLFPDAPIYTSYCSDEWRQKLDNKVVVGYLQHWPFSGLRKFLPLLRQWWFRSLDLSAFDLVISSSGNGEAKFVRVPEGVHINYCHTPVHFYWRHYDAYIQNPGFRPAWLARFGLRLAVKPLRQRDFAAAQKVDHFIANSTHIQHDIKTYYGQDAVTIFPPVAVERFNTTQNGPRQGFVTVGRLVPNKRVDILVAACSQLNVPLTVVGRGPELARLQKMAGPSVVFETDASDEAVTTYLSQASAFLFASFEDFGITPVEAMAAGTPVIAYQAGGALDYVTPGKTGLFFEAQTVESLCVALETFQGTSFDASVIRKAAERFSTERFQKDFQAFITTL